MADNKKPETKPAAPSAPKPAAKTPPKPTEKPAAKPTEKPAAKPIGPFVVKTLNDNPPVNPKAPPPTEKGPEPVQLCGARFSPCGKFIVAGGMIGQVLRWDASTDDFAPLPALSGHGGFVEALAFGAGGKLYTGDSWGRLRAWNYAEAAPKPLWDVADAHDGWLRDAAVSPDGQTVATCGRDKAVRLWNAADGKRMHEFTGHDDTFRVAFSPDGKLLASGDLFGNVKLWDIAAKKHLRDLDAKALAKLDRLQDVGGVRLLAFTPDGKRLLVGGTQPKNGGNVQGLPTLIEFDPATGKQTALQDYGAGFIYVCDVRYLADGTRAVALSGNPGTGKLLVEKPGDKTPVYENTKFANVHAVSVHPTLKRLVVTGMNSNSQGNGRVKGKNGEMDYPGNYSPVHVVEFPPAEKTA